MYHGSTTQHEHNCSIVFIMADDMRPELSPYVGDRMYTPNIQKLADSGLTFRNSHCQMAICSASRNSLLSGKN